MSAELRIVLAGFGGQGVLFAGKVAAYAGLIDDREVSWLPSYGPEMRGGTANCSVTLSDDPIGSPLVTTPNALVAMNQPSYDKFAGQVAEDAVVVADSDLVSGIEDAPGVRVSAIPATKLSQEAGLDGLSNIVLLGKLWDMTRFCGRETLDAAIDKSVPPSKEWLKEKNKQALQIGIDA